MSFSRNMKFGVFQSNPNYVIKCNKTLPTNQSKGRVPEKKPVFFMVIYPTGGGGGPGFFFKKN